MQKILMQKRIADYKRRVARLNRYVVVVALLWLVTSFALLFVSGSRRSDTAQVPPLVDNALHTMAAVVSNSSVAPVS